MERQTQLVPGATVYGAEGDKVGTMRSHGGNYIVVEKGFFFPTDYYIPLSAIETYTDEEVYLSLTKDDALNQGWDTEPTGDMAAPVATDTGTFESDAYQTGSYQDTGAQTGGYQDTSIRAGADQRGSTGSRLGHEHVDDTTMRVPVHEEQLEVTKRMADAGDVSISKRVVTEQQSIEVPVTEERLRVDWRTPSADTAVEGQVFEEGTLEIPLSREEVDVSKRTVRTGELEVTKERDERMEKVTDSVRREVVDVDDSRANVKGEAKNRRKSR